MTTTTRTEPERGDRRRCTRFARRPRWDGGRIGRRGEKLQAFTAAGRIANGRVYQVEMTGDFHPWRRDVSFVQPVKPAPIDALKQDLLFIAENRNWGLMVRRGHFEITAPDARLLADAMGIALTDEPLR